MRLRPNVLIDIKGKNGKTAFSGGKKRVNLSFSGRPRLYYSPFRYAISGFLFAALLGFTSVIAPTVDTKAQTVASDPAAERQALETELQDLEVKIAEYERTVSEYQKQGKTLSGEINRLLAQINKFNLQVKAINLNLSRLDKDITSTTNKIAATEDEMGKKKEAIASALRGINDSESQNILEILLLNPSISDFFSNVSNLVIIQSSLQDNLRALESLREDYITEKENLGDQRTNAANLKAVQEAQRKAIESLKKNKDNLLKVTKGKETEYQKVLKNTKDQAAEIRSRLFHLMGGGEMTFERAYELAEYASRATGVRPSLLLAILDQESALGKNVGRCDYKTAMHPKRDIPAFLEIIASLNMENDLASGKIKVSCPIVSDGAYGGAMGPSQFIPSTWKIYINKIKGVTGDSAANPWSNRDAFVATALYLKDSMDSKDCVNYSKQIPGQAQTLKERCSAAKYYAGGNWYRYRFAYGESVLDRAERFEADIAVMRNNN